MRQPDRARVLVSAGGQTVAAVGQILYEHNGVINQSDCMLQLTMEDGSTILLSGGGDGASLRVDDKPWIDPFAGPLSEENHEFVRTSGKWTFFDVSAHEGMATLVGARLHAARPIRDETGNIRGVQLHVGTEYLNYIVECDEGFLIWGQGRDALHQLGVIVA